MKPTSTRRTILKAGLIAVPSAAAIGVGGLGALWALSDVNTAGRVDFTTRLAIPPLAGSRTDGRGRRVFDLVAAAGTHQFRPGRKTPVWGIHGRYLGPTLRARRGETVQVNVRNQLPEPTTLHWHGMHLPAAMDGNPHQLIPRGGVWSPSWRIDQPAATLWYHPHPHQMTARHTYRGLAGMFILDNPDGQPAGLPHRYGVDDIPIVVQDKRLGDDNELETEQTFLSPVGLLGDVVCVNGTVGPYFDVTTERVRLRLLNASNARTYRFGLADDRPFALVATDGGLLAEPQRTTRIQLSPGERAEIVVAFTRGERVVLRSFPPVLGTAFFDRRFGGGDDTLDVLELRAARSLAPSPRPPSLLASPPSLHTAAVAATRRFEISGTKINNRRMDMHRIDFAVARDSVEVWEVVNHDQVQHNFHVHDVQFQVLSVGGAAPPPELRGWKDTVYTPPGRPVRLALRFGDYADPRTPYMYHCHLLWHEDMGLMGQFVVVEGGQTAPAHPAGHDTG